MHKTLRRLAALTLLLCVFVAPHAAYAAPEDTLPPAVGTEIENATSDTANPADTPYVPPDGALTPSGTGEVLDHVTDGTKEFYTFTTPAGNVFYLIVDHLREQDNVYFLNAVTEADLVALAGADNGLSGVSAIPPTPTEPKPQEQEPPAPSEPTAPSEEPQKSLVDDSTLIYAGAAVLIVGLTAYYFKIVKPKSKAQSEPEEEADEPYEDDDYDD